MSKTRTDKSRPWWKWVLYGLGGLTALLVVILIGVRLWIASPSGARFVENQIESRTLGPIEGVEIDGLSGNMLSEIRIDRLAIRDKDGVWLRAQDIRMDWTARRVLSRVIDIEALEAAEIDVIRRPQLNETPPSDNAPFALDIDALGVPRLILREDLAGQFAEFSLSGALSNVKNRLRVAADLDRTDQPGDSFTVDLALRNGQSVRGTLDVTGEAGGPLATLLEVPGTQTLTGQARIDGDQDSGTGEFSVSFDQTVIGAGEINWTEQAGQLTADISAGSWPLLAPLTDRVGQTLSLSGQVQRTDERPFDLSVEAPRASLDAAGTLPEDGFRPEQADIDFRTEALGDLVELPDGYAVGRVQLTGTLRDQPQLAFNGRVDGQTIRTPYGQAERINGPVELSEDGETLYNFTLDLTGRNVRLQNDVPLVLGRDAVVTAAGSFDREAQRLQLSSARVNASQSSLTSQGRVTLAPLSYDLSGRIDGQTEAIGQVPGGRLQARYRAQATANSGPAITANGQFQPRTALQPPLQSLMGETLSFETRMSPIKGGVNIRELMVTSENLRAAIAGRAGETLDISGEALTTAPFSYNGVDVGDRAAVTLNMIGPRSDPDIRVQAEISQITAGGLTLMDPVIKTELQDVLSAPKGPLEVQAQTDYGALDLAVNFASRPDALVANDLAMTLGDYRVNGDISRLASGLFDGQLRLVLPRDEDSFANASVQLSPRAVGDATEQGVRVNLDAENIAIGNYNFQTIDGSAEGNLSNLSGEIDITGEESGQLFTRPFSLQTPITMSRGTAEEGYTLTLRPDGEYGVLMLSSSSAVTAGYQDGRIDLRAPLLLNGKTVNLNYERNRAGEEYLTGEIVEAPIRLLPLPPSLGDTRGTWTASLDLSTQAGQPRGEAVVQIAGWRGFDQEQENGLTITTQVDINGTNGRISLDGSGVGDFNMSGEGQFALTPADSLRGLRPDMNAPLSGRFSASGDAQSVLGLVASSDAAIGGNLTAQIDIAGSMSSPRMDGQASGNDIRMESPELGTQIRNGRFRADFSNDGFSVSDVYADDTRGGTLTGRGEFKLGELGRPIGELSIDAQNFRLLDRRDMEARLAGNMVYSSAAEEANVSGEMTILEAEVKRFIQGGVSVVEIDVTEINREDQDEPVEITIPNTPINLDIALKAPRRIFIRSRGLDIEMALDARITGTVENPELDGTARVLRGGYRIAGKTLSFSTGEITFDGPIADARVNFVANTQTNNLSATLAITGTVSEPEIELSSNPERPQDEILSTILFGRSATELSTVQAAQLAGALAQFSGNGVGFDLMGGLRDALGVGQLSVGVSEDGNAQVTGGRYLASNVYLQVFSGAGEGQTGAIIDWEIRKNLSLRSKVQANNEQSLSVKYKKDF